MSKKIRDEKMRDKLGLPWVACKISWEWGCISFSL